MNVVGIKCYARYFDMEDINYISHSNYYISKEEEKKEEKGKQEDKEKEEKI